MPSCINSWLRDAYYVKNYTYYLYILQPLHHEFYTIKSSFFSGHDLSKRCTGDTGEGFRGMIMQLARGVCMLLMIFFSRIHKWIAYLCIKMEESLDTHRVAQGECHATRRLSFSTRMHALDDKFRFLYEMPFAAVWSSNIELFLSFLINMIICTVKIHSISRSPFYIYCCWRFSDVGIYRENMS